MSTIAFHHGARVDRSTRAAELLQVHRNAIMARTDRLFAGLMIFQWLFGIVLAVTVSPLTWSGIVSQTHIHVWAAVFLGGVIAALPVSLALWRPGQTMTRHVIGGGQMLFSALLIHLMGGRIEAHFHVFGSLAFLAFYRDWRVLITASAVVAADHYLRGAYWPQSVYGVAADSSWRWLEHAAWVLFEDVFLILSCRQGSAEMRSIAERQALIEEGRDQLEVRVSERTAELAAANEVLSAEVAERRRAESASNAKSEFLANMSHELRTPMHAILSFADLGMKRAETHPPDKLRDYFMKVHQSGSRLLVMLNNLLDLAKLEAGKKEFRFARQPMDDILTSAVNELESLFADHNLKLVVVACEPQEAMVDRDALMQVFRNILSNAIKFSPDGASIEISLTVQEGQGLVSISDRGPGIPDDELNLVFEQFVQARNTKTGAGGTGLGLAICQEIVEAHQGSIWATNRSGGGSTFHVLIPHERSVEATAKTAA